MFKNLNLIISRSKHKFPKNVRERIDYSKVPEVDFSDKRIVTERVMKGGGPGGQSVAKSNNCVQLTHVPTGIVVKNHESRSMERNRENARKKLIEELDSFYNGRDSVDEQGKRISNWLRERSKDSKEHKRLKGILDRLDAKDKSLLAQIEQITKNPSDFDNPQSKLDALEERLKEVREKIAKHAYDMEQDEL